MTKKRWILLIIIAILAVAGSLTAFFLLNDQGGGRDEYLELDGNAIEERHFTYFCTQAYDEAYRLTGVSGEALWSEKIEGKKTEEWIKDYAAELGKQYLIVNKLFDESGMTLDEDDLSDIETTAYNEWWYYGRLSIYGPMGIEEDTYTEIVTMRKKTEKLAKYYEDELDVTEDTVESYLRENYASFIYISMYYYDEAGDSAAEEYEELCKRVEEGKSVGELASELAAEGSELITTSVNSETGQLDVSVKLGGSGFPGGFLNQIFDAAVGDVIYYDDDGNLTYTISERTDIMADSSHLETYRDEITDVLLSEQFGVKISGETGNYQISVNKRNVNGFDVRELYS